MRAGPRAHRTAARSARLRRRAAADGSFRETFAGPGLDELLGGLPPGEDAHAAWWDGRPPGRSRDRAGDARRAGPRRDGRGGVPRWSASTASCGACSTACSRARRPAAACWSTASRSTSASRATGVELPEPDEALYVLQLAPDGATRAACAPGRAGRACSAPTSATIPTCWPRPGPRPCTRATPPASWRRASGCAPASRPTSPTGWSASTARSASCSTARRRRRARDGSVLAAGIVVDVTAERRARTELEETRRRLETVLAAVAEVVFTEQLLDDGGRHAVFVGPGLEGLLGGSVAREALPEAWDAAVHPDDRAAWSRHLAAIDARRGGRPGASPGGPGRRRALGRAAQPPAPRPGRDGASSTASPPT